MVVGGGFVRLQPETRKEWARRRSVRWLGQGLGVFQWSEQRSGDLLDSTCDVGKAAR
jgi:hypothetical protein